MMFTAGVPKNWEEISLFVPRNVRLPQLQKTRMEGTVVGNLEIIMHNLQRVHHQLQSSWIGGQHVVIILLTEAKTMKAKPKRHLQRSSHHIFLKIWFNRGGPKSA
jgi:hypothetical protein